MKCHESCTKKATRQKSTKTGFHWLNLKSSSYVFTYQYSTAYGKMWHVLCYEKCDSLRKQQVRNLPVIRVWGVTAKMLL